MKNTAIEWADHTFNPWIGCAKVSPACDNCYAEALMDKRMHVAQWGAGRPRHRTSASNWRQPVKWNAEAAAAGKRARVFCASLADVFDNEVPSEWRRDLLRLIAATQNLDWLLLTKRIGNARPMLAEAAASYGMTWDGWRNVWIGATVVNQEEADRDIPKLIATPAHRRFLSIEPMLGPVDLSRWMDRCDHGSRPGPGGAGGITCSRCGGSGDGCTRIDWVIVGGESGPHARPMHPDWARSLRDQCVAAGVPFLFKQWGEWREPEAGEEFDTTMGRAQRVPAFIVAPAGTVHCFESEATKDAARAMLRVGKKAAGRLLDGRAWDEVPS